MAELTEDERKWLRKVQRVLKQCPSTRLGFYTSGDPCINVYDKNFDAEIDSAMARRTLDFGPCVYELDADLGRLDFPSNVHSTCA